MYRLEMDGPLPDGLLWPGLKDPCVCGSGQEFEKCSWAKTLRRSTSPRRLLIIGAGATIEECRRSGADPSKPLPSIANFGNQLFQESENLQRVIATYLHEHGIAFDRTVLDVCESSSGDRHIPHDSFVNSPLRVYQRLEAKDPSQHNVERLFEHVWRKHGNDGDLWEALVWSGIFTYLFNAFITQFGLGPANTVRTFQAGLLVANQLYGGDRVINLNYDVAFDLGLQQADKYFSYAPEPKRAAIVMYKPHGSFNLYCDRQSGDCFFGNPSHPRGSVAIRNGGRIWSPASAFVPPRLHKSYDQHPGAAMILADIGEFSPDVVSFWGVGLTDSDIDLAAIYRNACAKAKRVEFINPDLKAFENAATLLNVPIHHYPRLDDWLTGTASGNPDGLTGAMPMRHIRIGTTILKEPKDPPIQDPPDEPPPKKDPNPDVPPRREPPEPKPPAEEPPVPPGEKPPVEEPPLEKPRS